MNEKKTDMKKVIRNKSGRLLCYLFLITAVFASLFPFYWMIVCSTNSNPDILQKRLTFGTYFGREFQKSCEQRYHCPRFLEFPDYFGLRMLINAHRMLYGWVWLCQV